MRSSKDLTQEEYDEPIFYCKACHSCFIKIDDNLADEDWDGSFCGKCMSTDIAECKFGKWLEEEEAEAERKRIREWSR